MIDPTTITNFNQTGAELEEVLLFWICVSGKTASVVARQLNDLLNSLKGKSPFDKIKKVGENKLPELLKSFGIGCYNSKSKSLWQIVNADLDLRTCTVDDLEKIHGIGRKTSRCFIMHSRPDAQYAGLDTHALKFLRDKGHNVPASTPASKRLYLEIEKLFLEYVKKSKKSVAEFDLDIWRSYARIK